MAKQVELEETDLPINLELNDEAPERKPASRRAEPAAAGDGYSPKPDVVDRLNKMKKDEIKKELGIDIDYLMRTTKKYGVLEALAYGDYTKPIDVELRTSHGARLRTKATVRIYSFPDGEWFSDIHPVALKNKLDKDGKPMVAEDGRPVMMYDRNPITKEEVDRLAKAEFELQQAQRDPHTTDDQIKALRKAVDDASIIEFNGVRLSATQCDHLRLTGHLGEPVTATNRKGERVTAVVSVDPYNNHCICSISDRIIASRLSAKDSFVYKEGAEKESRTILLDEKKKGELALGYSVWGKNDKGEWRVLQYNAATSRLELSTDYDNALKRERSVTNGNGVSQSRTQTATVTQQNVPAKGVGASL